MKIDAATTPDHDHSPLGLDMPAKAEQVATWSFERGVDARDVEWVVPS